MQKTIVRVPFDQSDECTCPQDTTELKLPSVHHSTKNDHKVSFIIIEILTKNTKWLSRLQKAFNSYALHKLLRQRFTRHYSTCILCWTTWYQRQLHGYSLTVINEIERRCLISEVI